MIELPSRAKKLMLLGGAACTMYGGIVLWKDALAGKKYEHVEPSVTATATPQVEGKVFIVTGANSGIGREVVHELARRKGKVFMACRDLNKCEEARKQIVLDTRNKYVYCRKCDLADFQSVRDFVESFSAQEQKCDVLLNNAGVMKPKPRQLTSDGLELQLQTNHTGHLLLTDLLRDRLREAGGRVVYMVNLDYRKGKINFGDLNSDQQYDPTTSFNQSQIANMLAVRGLATELEKDKVTVNAVYPGVCGTNIKRHMGVDRSITGNIVANPILWFLTRSAERGAQTPIFASIDPSLAKVSGKLFSNMTEMEVEEVGKDDLTTRRLLAVSRYWAGLMNKEEVKVAVTREQ